MINWKKIARGVAQNGLLGIGLLGLFLSHKQYLSQNASYVHYVLTCAGLYLSAIYLLEEPGEGEEADKEGAGSVIARDIMDGLKPALEKQIAESTEIKQQLRDMQMKNFRCVFEKITRRYFEGNLNEEVSKPGAKEKRLTKFHRILKKCYEMPKLGERATAQEIWEILRRCDNEMAKPGKEFKIQTSPILMDWHHTKIMAAENTSSDICEIQHLNIINDELSSKRDAFQNTCTNGTTSSSSQKMEDSSMSDSSI